MARAPALQAGGQEFDSPHLHQVELRIFKILDSIIILKYNRVIRRLDFKRKHIEKYIGN